MDSALKQKFTMRLSQCNKGELIVIMYDMIFTYMDEAYLAKEAGNHDAFKLAVKNGQDVISSLIHALDFSYDVSKQLYSLYVYCRNMLAKALYQYSTDGIEESQKILKRLYEAFSEAAKTDTSGPLMRNTQRVYAGMTYGRNTLNENCYDDNHRGFFV